MFREIHGANNRDTPSHPHGVSVIVPPGTFESTFDPSKEDPVYLHVSAHEDPAHLDETWVDLRRSLTQVEGTASMFRVELRRRAER